MLRSSRGLVVLNTCLALLAFNGWSAEHPPRDQQSFRILYHEPVELDSYSDVGEAIDAETLQGLEPLSFDAFGQHFSLQLESNQRLIAKLSRKERAMLGNSHRLLRGTLSGVAGSWVRLTQIGPRLSGAIWDGTELYLIDSSNEVAASLDAPPDSDGTEPVIYRLSDTVDLSDSVCALESTAPRGSSGQQRLRSMVEHLERLAEATATLELDIALVADAEFVRANANPRAAALARANVVDGIFSEQVGVRLNVTDVDTLSSNGSLTSSNAGTLLNQFSALARNNNPGLAHLLTGRDLDGNVIGIAGLSTLCSPSRGVGLSQASGGGTAGALIMAHELGHNFGAPHDNQGGSSCAGTAGTFLMNPRLNGSDTFSQCSLAQIRPVVERAQCIRTINAPPPPPPPEPEPPTPGRIVFSANFDANNQGWRYADDTFNGTTQGRYARGVRATSGGFGGGGALSVVLGGRDTAVIRNMSGGFSRSFFRPRPQRATLTFRVLLTQAANYEDDEFSEALVSVDGATRTVARITGNGNGGPERSTGWRSVEIDIGTLSRGRHRITIGGFNNKKTFTDETTRVLIDDVVMRVR